MIADVVTDGLDSELVRLDAHEVVAELMKLAGGPIVARELSSDEAYVDIDAGHGAALFRVAGSPAVLVVVDGALQITVTSVGR